MDSFSFCIITKNEEKIIGKCLKPLAATGKEIIVLDTGSTDATLSIVQKYTDKIFHFTWINDFSAARNYAMQQASNDYILFIDSDEILESINAKEIESLMHSYPNAIGRLKRRNLCPNGASTNIMDDFVERLFDRRKFCYQGKIHEQVVSRTNQKLLAYEIPLTLFHEGYLGSKEEIRKKVDRNNQLLFEDLKENPNDCYLYYQLGQSFGLCEDYESSYQYYSKGYALHPDLSLEYVKVMVVSYGYCMIATKRYEEAATLRSCYSALSSYADYICMLGDLYIHMGLALCALNEFKHALTLQDYHVEGSTNAIPAHNLGCIYEAYGNETMAEKYYEKAIFLGFEGSKDRLNKLRSKTDYETKSKEKLMCLVLTCQCEASELSSFLSSLSEQTIGLDHLLIICICSTTQHTMKEMLLQYEKDYPDSVLFVELDTEANYGSSCNVALEYIATDYVAFFTGREYLHPEYCRQIMQVLQSNPSDVLLCNTSSQLDIHVDPTEDGESALLHPRDPEDRKSFLLVEKRHAAISTHVFSYSFLIQQGLPLSGADVSACFQDNDVFTTTYQTSVTTWIWLNATLLRHTRQL